jgi:hypothetical protein
MLLPRKARVRIAEVPNHPAFELLEPVLIHEPFQVRGVLLGELVRAPVGVLPREHPEGNHVADRVLPSS